MTARQYFFSGRVQGVGFRYSTKQLAKGFDVLGWVRNLGDGRVELQIMGDEEELDEFIQEMHDSPMGHHIQEQEERAVPLLEGVRGFSIRD
ncbi:acylphosphatase [Verrucomicrobiales bacterium]|jgi:acylphosphatase|nr:acylphosphatase [Verrucomicrobiales bacterium]MDA9922522.1 acylphosphatase [Verrucomicrobiales bacterium]MDB2496100.1 acylphosphatase [Verrucomicrobiales bacterium]MDB3941284.1 acylphosphatase [Verrucomicrobiales bacterium]MDC3353324.1 acylphosphatase [Verrucomicrobiales bacterium]